MATRDQHSPPGHAAPGQDASGHGAGSHADDDRWLAVLAGQEAPDDAATRQADSLRRYLELQAAHETPLSLQAKARMAQRLKDGLMGAAREASAARAAAAAAAADRQAALAAYEAHAAA
ncbi:MAG: hypothetical protein RLZZ584_2813, partial [Pseudomonadota bacterium]